MQNDNPTLKVKLFKKLTGVRSGSGLVYENDNFYIISDNSDFLYIFDGQNPQITNKTALNPEGVESQNWIEKALKVDYEAIAINDGKCFVFGSGSTPNRCQMVELNIREESIEFDKKIDLKEFYSVLRKDCDIRVEDFNIEGVVLDQENAYFFNRGNGPNQKNGIIWVENWNTTNFKVLKYIPLNLPEIEGVSYIFSDAVLIDDNFYFVSTAENTESTYDDGEIIGSSFGIIDKISFELKLYQKITDEYKVEGLVLYKNENEVLHFVLSEDSDDDVEETDLLSLFVGR